MKIENANGAEGCLIYEHGTGKFYFRVYGKGSFKDYDIYHSDLFVKIDDKDASFYEHEDGRMMLDHSPETLGIGVDNGKEN